MKILDEAIERLRRESQLEEISFHALRDLMSSFSEEFWCAGWVNDLEHLVWDMITSPKDNERVYLSDRNKIYLLAIARLANSLNCWVWWDKSKSWEEGHEQPISFDDWQEKHAAWRVKSGY